MQQDHDEYTEDGKKKDLRICSFKLRGKERMNERKKEKVNNDVAQVLTDLLARNSIPFAICKANDTRSCNVSEG